MIQTINPYASARTAEIMSRYRPIAPKPDSLLPPPDTDASTAVPNGISKSPYLRNVWAHLQARPTRTRKRGRSAAFSPPSLKRIRTTIQTSPANMHGLISLPPSLVPLKCGLDTAVATLAAESVALREMIDLNMRADHAPPKELELLPLNPVRPGVISPRPVRPVGSSIIVDGIFPDSSGSRETVENAAAEEVEEAVEKAAEPAIVSDSNNKVRMSNAAYKEMVGQPECCWLECALGKRSTRIGGEVALRFAETEVELAMAAFRCAAKIEWECEGKKMCVNAACSAVRLACEGKDYQFLWRFYTNEEGSKGFASDN